MSEITALMRSNLHRIAERLAYHGLAEEDKLAALAVDNLEHLIDEIERADRRKAGQSC